MTYLHDGVRHLTSPKRDQTLVQGTEALLGNNLGSTVHHTLGEAGLGLHADLDGLEWAQGDVGNDLSTGRGRSVQQCAILEGVLLTGNLGEQVLEVLIETEFAQTLSGVTEQSGAPTGGQNHGSLFLHGNTETIENVLVGISSLQSSWS